MRVAAGSIAKTILANLGVSIQGYVSQVGSSRVPGDPERLDLSLTEENIVRCPHSEIAKEIEQLILQTRKKGDTIGGIVICLIKNFPPGIIEPVFNNIYTRLAHVLM